MKQRLFVIMAAMLLGISAFAQSESTLKDDVNGDGKVDIEDVTFLVDIILSGKTYGYFYFGTTQPTADNYQTLSGVVASYTSISEAVGTAISVDAGQTVYMLCPAEWMKGKHVEVEDGEGNSYGFVEDTDAGTISGYVIYKTQAFNEATEAVLEFINIPEGTCYWYVGTTKPTSLSQATIVDKYESPYTFTNPSTTEKCYVYVLTRADKDVIFKDPGFQYGEVSKTEDTTTIPEYKISSTEGRIARGGSILINVLDEGWKHFYIGTTQPTAENYETLTPQYSSLSDMNGATVHVPSSGKIYVMLPYQDSPNQSQMKRAFTDNEGNIVTCIERTGDALTIPFHMIWELTFEPGTTLTFKEPPVYYFYVGTTKPTSLSDAWPIGSYPAEETYTNNSGAKSHIFVLTNNDKTVIFEDPNTHGTVSQESIDTTTISGYNIFETSIGWANTKDIIIKIL